MKLEEFQEQFKLINRLKSEKNYLHQSLSELQKLPILNGILEFNFDGKKFSMLNIFNDDAVPLKYLWRDEYENLSLKIWYEITRKEGVFFDVGAHTGIYSIIGNLNKNKNSIISLEPFYLNYARLMSNLKLNNMSSNNCILSAASNEQGVDKFLISTSLQYHSSGGKISESGNISVKKIKLDNINVNNKISGIKIDTEGHELEVLEGAKILLNKFVPDIIFEINEEVFNKCINILKNFGYKFYFIDEKEKKIVEILQFNDSLKRIEGSNCYATTNNSLIKSLKILD